jgi:hypothetical protein
MKFKLTQQWNELESERIATSEDLNHDHDVKKRGKPEGGLREMVVGDGESRTTGEKPRLAKLEIADSGFTCFDLSPSSTDKSGTRIVKVTTRLPRKQEEGDSSHVVIPGEGQR